MNAGIAMTSLLPDNVIWCTSIRTVIMAKLAIPCEEGMEAAFRRKKEM